MDTETECGLISKQNKQALNAMAKAIHQNNSDAGWWSPEDIDALNIGKKMSKQGVTIVAMKLALVHSEVSEALEGIRKGLNDEHLPNRKMFEVEIADVFIRLFDIAGACKIDLGGAFIEKLAYNQKRQDHKKENREGTGGKII